MAKSHLTFHSSSLSPHSCVLEHHVWCVAWLCHVLSTSGGRDKVGEKIAENFFKFPIGSSSTQKQRERVGLEGEVWMEKRTRTMILIIFFEAKKEKKLIATVAGWQVLKRQNAALERELWLFRAECARREELQESFSMRITMWLSRWVFECNNFCIESLFRVFFLHDDFSI